MKKILFVLCLGLEGFGYGQLTDKRDGEKYKTVKIGEQVWMAENLRYASGNYITTDRDWVEVGGSKKYCWYDDNISYKHTYGALYTYHAAKNACPEGWHLPSDEEWTILTNYLGGKKVAGTKMKSATGWYKNGNGTNESGFNALPAGARGCGSGIFFYLHEDCHFWSSSKYEKFIFKRGNGKGGINRSLTHKNGIGRHSSNELFGFSVRCVKD